MVPLPELTEADELAVGRRDTRPAVDAQRLGRAILLAVDTHGAAPRGAPCRRHRRGLGGVPPALPRGSYLPIADVGDDRAARHASPFAGSRTGADTNPRPAEACHATYPDGPHDAETLLVTPPGEFFIVTKGERGRGALYSSPRPPRRRDRPLERVGEPRPTPGAAANITDGAVSADGPSVALRTGQARRVLPEWVLPCRPLAEEAGDGLAVVLGEARAGIAFAADASVYLAGEGGRAVAGRRPRAPVPARSTDSRSPRRLISCRRSSIFKRPLVSVPTSSLSPEAMKTIVGIAFVVVVLAGCVSTGAGGCPVRTSGSSCSSTVDQLPLRLPDAVSDRCSTSRLKRLLTERRGLRRMRASNTPGTVAPVGRSTMLTGATPAVDSIIGNDWFDRETAPASRV